MHRFPVSALRSVEIAVPDLHASERFYTEVWGLTVAARTSDAVHLAATGLDHHVLELRPGATPALESITFRAASREGLDEVAARAERAGGAILSGPVADLGPAGGTVLTIREPQGSTLRLVHGDRVKPEVRSTRPVPVRLAHVNVNSRDVDGLTRFYEDALGFQLTDRSKLMAFARTNADHHAVVLAEAPTNGLNHVAFLMPDLEAVMRGSGRLVDHGYPIGWGVGRHGPGDNVFAYFLDPDGIVVEYTAEVQQVGDDHVVRGPAEWTWPPGRSDHWGIAPPKPDHVKAAQLAVPFGVCG